MADYNTIIAELNPSPGQIEQARAYALEQITEQVLESDPYATVELNEGTVSIGPESSDFTHAMQDEFDNLFESKLKQLKADDGNKGG